MEQQLEQLRADYIKVKPTADRLLVCLRTQIYSLIEINGIALGVPMETRVKTLSSIENKFERKSKSSLSEIDDLVGVRLVLLFQKDVESMDEIIKSIFHIMNFEDTSTRLQSNQFGYQSNHYIVKIPQDWLKIPSYADLGEISAELQVRTLSQHIWAAASHKLQYKREESVPRPLLRSINRVSALLETVDLEFSRLLVDRETYVEKPGKSPNEKLNVDLLVNELSNFWPEENISEQEKYDDLLLELENSGIDDVETLRSLLEKHRSEVMRIESVHFNSNDEDDPELDHERHAKGVFFTHVGLTRIALQEEARTMSLATQKT